MKAIFIGKASWYTSGEYSFTTGNEYDLRDCGGGYYLTIDDNGTYAVFDNGRHYLFEILHEKTKQSKEHDMIYQMNGVEVSEKYFNDKLLEVELLKGRGVSVFIDFEVGFK